MSQNAATELPCYGRIFYRGVSLLLLIFAFVLALQKEREMAYMFGGGAFIAAMIGGDVTSRAISGFKLLIVPFAAFFTALRDNKSPVEEQGKGKDQLPRAA